MRKLHSDGGCGGAVADLCRQLEGLLASGACACEHTADQLIVYMALADGKSRLRAPPAKSTTSMHLPTVIHFAQLLSGATFRIATADDGCQIVECDGIGAIAAPAPPLPS